MLSVPTVAEHFPDLNAEDFIWMLRDMVKIRMDAGFPLEKLAMHNTSKFDEEDTQMLRKYVGHLEWYLHGIPD